jgi:hypothetical protein
VEEPCLEKKRINGLLLRLHEEAHVEVLYMCVHKSTRVQESTMHGN